MAKVRVPVHVATGVDAKGKTRKAVREFTPTAAVLMEDDPALAEYVLGTQKDGMQTELGKLGVPLDGITFSLSYKLVTPE